MARKDPSVTSKIAFLHLVQELGNVSQACRITGYSRDTYYRLKKYYAKGGEPALRNQSRSRQLLKNQVSENIQQRILKLACEQPELGQRAVAEELTSNGMKVSHNGVRSVWLRYDLETRRKRLEALKAKSEQGELRITEKQMEAFHMLAHRYMDESGELISKYPGYLLVQDTFTVDKFTDLSPLYLHIAIDSYTRYTFARYYTLNCPKVSSDFLLEYILPWFQKKGIHPKKMLTDRGAEFYQPKTPSDYQILLQQQKIEHLLVKAYNSSELNGLCRQFEKLVETEFFSKIARKGQYTQLQTLQDELDQWLEEYNTDTAQSSRYCYGKTPTETLASSIHLYPTSK